ncbi:unnamed protein product [Discula destructiva]
MASAPHILRLSLEDAADTHVLVAVSPSDAASDRLDLELLATDDTKAYVMTLSQSRLARYRAPKTCSESDWEDALQALFLADKPIGDIEATARIADDEEKPTGDERSYMFIDVRSKVSGRAKALGTLKLRKSNKAEASVELFDWCVETIKARDKLAHDVCELRREHDALRSLVAEETAKIQELARGKKEFEAAHDSWLKDLLNEKKVKIRTQEQLLATARVDPDKLAAAAKTSKPHRSGAGLSRAAKRKAETSEGDDSDDDADKMDLDVDEVHESHGGETDEVDRGTTGSETASEPEYGPEPKSNQMKGARASPASAAESSVKNRRAGHKLRDKKVVTANESDEEASPSRTTSSSTKKKLAPVSELHGGGSDNDNDDDDDDDDDDVTTGSE